MKLDQSILVLIQVHLYMGSIETTICLYNFYNLCSSLLSYALFLYSFYSSTLIMRISYNTYEGDFLSFPSYNSKISYWIKFLQLLYIDYIKWLQLEDESECSRSALQSPKI